MGQNLKHQLFYERSFFAKAETTFGTQVKPVTGDAMKVLSAMIKYSKEIKDRVDNSGSRDIIETIEGSITNEWEAEMYLLPNGSAGTAPDCGPFLTAGLGVETVTPATSVVYSTTDTQAVQGSLSIYDLFSDIQMNSLFGAYVNEIAISASGRDEPKIKFSGMGKTYAHSGYATCNGAVSGTSVAVQSGEGLNFDAGSLIKIGSDDNSGTGHKVTEVSGDTLTIADSATASDDDPIIPWLPAETTAGSPIAGIDGSLTIDSTELPIMSFDVTINNNWKPVDDEVGEQTITDIIEGKRTIEGSVKFRARRDMGLEIGKYQAITSRDFVVLFGSTSGSKVQIDMDYVKFITLDKEVSEGDSALYTGTFKAFGSSGNDAFSIKFF